jgi:hypothetical protein
LALTGVVFSSLKVNDSLAQVLGTATSAPWYNAVNSAFVSPIPSTATYTKDTNLIGSIRPNYIDYSIPIYTIKSALGVPLVKVTNTYSGRIANWPIPVGVAPSAGSDHHLAVLDQATGTIYEMWDAVWSGKNSITAGGMNSFSLQGNGISVPTNYRVTASGFSVTAGMVVKADFINPTTNTYDPNMQINHALTMSIPHQLIQKGAFVAPAIGSEDTFDNTGTIPMGARFALPKTLNVDSLAVHPLTKAMIRAVRDYGVYINDRNGAGLYNSKYAGTVRLEPGLTDVLFAVPNDTLLATIQSQFYSVISQYGLYRVTGVNYANLPTPLPTTVPTPAATAAPAPITTSYTIMPTSAVYVRKTSPNSSYTTDSLLKVGGVTGDISYLTFALTNVPKTGLKSAILKMYVNNTSVDAQNIEYVASSWNTPMTYNTRPPITSFLKTITGLTKTGWYSVDITSIIQGSMGGTFSIAMDSSSTDAYWFASTTTTTKPQIILSY